MPPCAGRSPSGWRDQAVLRLRSGYCRGRIGADTFERRLEAVLIGRSRSCDLVLRDDSVSRRWITQAEARPGDVLRLGEIELRL